MADITQEQKNRLEPFGNVFADMDQQVRSMSDDDLQALWEACAATTVTNCWCCSFEAAKYLTQEIRRELYQRKQRVATAQ